MKWPIIIDPEPTFLTSKSGIHCTLLHCPFVVFTSHLYMNTACSFALTRLVWSPVGVVTFSPADPLELVPVVLVIQAAPTSLFPQNTVQKFLLICIIHCYQIGLFRFTDFLSLFPGCYSSLPALTKVTVSTIKIPALVTALVCKGQTETDFS